jgi:hypothetical protein
MPEVMEDRNQILRLVEAGNLTAAQAAQLLDALEPQQNHAGRRGRLIAPDRNRQVRVRVTSLSAPRQKVNVVVPASLIRVALRLATRLAPQVSGSALEDLLRAMESGATGRLLDLQDLEEGERVEIFAE